MTNDFSVGAHWVRGIHDWSPCSPVEGGQKPANTHREKTSPGYKDWHDDLQVLEEERLGSVLLRAWKGQYKRVADIAEDIKANAEKMGIKVVGNDEVANGEKWEDVFEIVEDPAWKWGQRLVFKEKEKDGQRQQA
jgi:hypothetical protein